jgi:hypothetical protein
MIMGVRYFDWGLTRFEANGAPLVLLFHLIDFSDPLPARLVRGWKRRLFTLSGLPAAKKLDACRTMLDRVARSYRVTHTDDMIEAALQGGRLP